MNQFESRESRPKSNADEGWVVQVYGNNRRLLCVLEPSHGWVFSIGCGVGLLLAILWINVARYNPPLEPTTPAPPPALQVD